MTDSDNEPIALSALSDAAAVRHGFFTRRGGVSEGLFASLNCGFGSGDERDRVERNRAAVAARIGVAPGRLATCYQVHGTAVVTVDRPWPHGAAPRADAMVSRMPGLALGILTADCAPVLFAEPQAGVIGAAHGGWRGTLAGVLEAAVSAMAALGARPERIRAGIGPCIAQPSYEVGADFRDAFLAADPDSGGFFVPAARPGHQHFDLPGYAARRLERLGLAVVERANRDTAAEQELFFSYRRACLQGERDYGRALSAIALAA